MLSAKSVIAQLLKRRIARTLACRSRGKTQLHYQVTETDEVKSVHCSDDIQKEVQNLVNNTKHSDHKDEEISIYVKYTDQLLEYKRVFPSKRHPTTDIYAHNHMHRERQTSSMSGSASSVEDYLYAMPKLTTEAITWTQLPKLYASLSKSKLTMLVVFTAMGGYALAPGPFDAVTLSMLAVGTAFQSASANAVNQTIEVKYDTQMHRTKNRVLVRGLISRQHAAAFAAVAGVLGTSVLYYGVNPLACYIGVANHLLYTCVYTPMKRVSIINTWIGSVVGALPPLMGWSAATAYIDSGGLWLATLLYIWQFPHFKSLSWNIKADYQRAGYIMSSVYNPEQCKAVAFRHTIFMTLACCLGPAVDATTSMFIAYSLPCNLYGVYLGWRFYTDGDSNSSRKLFRFSLIQIPYLIMMMLISKKWSEEDLHRKATHKQR